MQRHIEKIAKPTMPHFVGDGFRVHNFIPKVVAMQRADPFIILDYNAKYYFPPSQIPKGVGSHPHRGFETVTIAYKGKVEHTDSSGGGGVIGEGDVQWMTAASGVLHKEFHETRWSKHGGEFQMVQLWVNLPADKKMSPPKYQSIKNSDIPRVILPNNNGFIEVIAGEYNGQNGIASTFSPVNLFNAKIKANANADFNFPKHYNSSLLVVEGNIKVNNTDLVNENHFALFDNQGESFSIQAQTDAIVLIMSGEPLNQPIVAYGPFVMNTEMQIRQAISDFNSGKFGYLE